MVQVLLTPLLVAGLAQTATCESELRASLHTKETPEATIYGADASGVEQGSASTFTVDRGKVLVDVKKPITIFVHDTKIELQPGTVVSVSNNDGILRITNLYEPRHECMTVTCGKRYCQAAVAEEICISGSFDELSAQLGNEAGRRKVLTCDQMPSGAVIVHLEVSLLAALQNNEVAKQLQNSTSGRDRKLFNKLLKMAACVGVVHRNW